MPTTTEQEIVNLLTNRKPLSILEMAKLLNLTKADIRYHVKNMLTQNKIVKIPPKEGAPGRPAFRYKISDDEFKHNLDFLTNGLLSLFPNKSELINNLSDNFVSDFSPDENRTIITKLNSLIYKFLELNYLPRWETQFQGPIIYFGNCPYRKLIENHPELCELDKMIISKYLNQDVEIEKTIAKESLFCKFQILIKNLARRSYH